MTVKTDLQSSLELEENRTVGDSFGGDPLGGRSPAFRITDMADAFLISAGQNATDPVAILNNQLSTVLNQRELKYAINSALRFSFIIELTNLKITSTKMKTRWVQGRVIKTNPGTFTNFEGNFLPGEDQRASDFDTCYAIFQKSLELLLNSDNHIEVVKQLSTTVNRRISYEFVYTYIDPSLNPVHIPNNIRLVHQEDIDWLIKGRSIIREALPNSASNKIKTKTYLTDQLNWQKTHRPKTFRL